MEERRNNDNVFKLHLENLGIKIDNLAESNNEKFKTIIDYNKSQDRQIKEINVVLRGNGNPEVGHSTRLTRLEEKVKILFQRNKIQLSVAIIILGLVAKLAFF